MGRRAPGLFAILGVLVVASLSVALSAHDGSRSPEGASASTGATSILAVHPAGGLTAQSLTYTESPATGKAPVNVSFTVHNVSSVALAQNFSFYWNFTDGKISNITQVHGIAGKIAFENISHTYTQSGLYVPHVTIRDDKMEGAIILNTSILVQSSVLVHVVTTPVGNATTIGRPINVTLVASNGVPPYTYKWRVVPTGCLANASATILCIPTTTGKFGVEYSVIDSASPPNSVTSNFSFTVNPTMKSSIGATAHFVCLGAQANLYYALTDTFTGGSSPFNVSWTYSDGSTPQYGASVNHVATPGATFTVTAKIKDVAGSVTSNATTITPNFPTCAVVPAPSYTPPQTLLEASVGVVAAIVVILVVLILLTTRRDPEPRSPPTPAEIPPDTGGVSPPPGV